MRASLMVLRKSGTNGRRSPRRFDLPRRIRIGDAPARKILLVFQPPIHGHEDLEAGFLREIEQEAIFLVGEACFGYGVALMLRLAVL